MQGSVTQGAMTLPDLMCARCGTRHAPTTTRWRCDCGGPLDLALEGPGLDPAVLHERSEQGVWRYREALPPVAPENIVTLGEGGTPLIAAPGAPGLRYKLEFLFPTGSFKDRGSTVLASCLKQLGVSKVVEDSSGNAGASMAAYFSAANIACDVYVPASTSPAKTRQIRSYGAQLILVEGTRSDVTRAAESVAEQAYYASHLWSPYFLAGMKTFAFETWEQLDRRLPDNVLVPVGAGTLLLGVYQGFRDLVRAGLVDRMPRIYGVQAENCAPLYHAHAQGRDSVEDLDFPFHDTLAEGIRIQRPPRDREILQAVRDSRGAIVVVSEDQIYTTWFMLASRGLFVEPTATVAAGAAERMRAQGEIRDDEITVVALTGTGLKMVGDVTSGLSPLER